ncbi:MAG: tetratricopeptide repeat protein, partial [Planctomycetota bacterium]
ELYPESSNVYNSLGEGLLADKQYDESLRSYRKSVKLDPSNAGGKKAIEQIERLLSQQNQR